MRIDKGFNVNSPTVSRLGTSLRLRNLGFEGKRRQIQYESFIQYTSLSFDANFFSDFEFEVKILFSSTHFREKCVLKISVGIFNFFIALNSQ